MSCLQLAYVSLAVRQVCEGTSYIRKPVAFREVLCFSATFSTAEYMLDHISLSVINYLLKFRAAKIS